MKFVNNNINKLYSRNFNKKNVLFNILSYYSDSYQEYNNKIKIFYYQYNIKKYNKSKSLIKLKNYFYLNIFLNSSFKNGLKSTFFKNLLNFFEEFYKYLDENFLNFINQDNYKFNLYDLILRKQFYFDFNNLIPLLLSKYEIMFDIKNEKISKNLKKLKRKPTKTQLIFIKKKKRLSFLIKLIMISMNRYKKKNFFDKIFFFFLNQILINSNESVLIERKKLIYFKVIKKLKNKNN